MSSKNETVLFNQCELRGVPKFLYISSPCYHKDYGVVRDRVEKVTEVVEFFSATKEWIFPFSPVMYAYPLEVKGKRPKAGYIMYDLGALNVASHMMVLMLDGWEESEGIAKEIAFCKGKDIPIVYMTFENAMKDSTAFNHFNF